MNPPTHPRPGDPPQPDGVATAPEAADVLSAYRTASAEADDSGAPRAETRAAILAAAARAVAARPRAAGGSGSGGRPAGARFRPQVPLALAASLMVGLFAWQLLPHLDEAPSPERLASAPVPAPASPAKPSPERQPSGDLPAAPAAARAKAKANEVTAKAFAPDPAADRDGGSQQRRAAAPPPAPPPAASAAATPAAEATLADSAVLNDADKSARRKSSEVRNSFAAPPPQTPEAWLERIAELRRSGRDDDAETEIRALRLAYPQVRIPPALLSPGPR
jgi:hypothetical protein